MKKERNNIPKIKYQKKKKNLESLRKFSPKALTSVLIKKRVYSNRIDIQLEFAFNPISTGLF